MKKQEKLVTRWAPANLLDTRRAEGWLEKMAAQGLIYRRQSSWNAVTGVLFRSCPHIFLAQFHREEPRPLRRYRLVPAPRQGRPHPEQLELYAQSGWQYADYIDLFYTSFLLFFSDDPGAVEPYTDPDSFSLAYRFPLRGLVAALLLLGGFSVLSSALSLQLAGDSTTLLAVLSSWGGAISQVLALLFALAVLVNLVLDARAVGLIRRQVQERQTTRPTLPETLFPAQKRLTLTAVGLFLAGLLLSVVLIILILLQLPRTDIPLERLETDFDLLTLSEMEGDGSWTPSQDWEAMNIQVRYNVADVYENPAQEIEVWYHINQDGSGSSGSSSMDLDYCLAHSAQTAQAILDTLAQTLQDPEGGLTSRLSYQIPFQTETVPGAEEFLVRREGTDWEVLAQTGTRVLLLQYSGAQDLTQWYGDIAAMLTPRAGGELQSAQLPSQESVPLSEFDPDFPLLTLEEMEEAGTWEPSDPDTFAQVSPSLTVNYADVYWNAGHTAPVRYSVRQSGQGASGYSTLTLRYYLSDTPQTAQEQLETLLSDSSEPPRNAGGTLAEPAPFQELSIPGAEEFLVRSMWTDPESGVVPDWTVVARKDSRVLSLHYSGYLDLSEWYDEIAAMLTPEG